MPRNRDLRKPCSQPKGVTRHEELIRALVDSDPRMCRHGFRRSLTALCEEEGLYDDDFPARDFVPDAYLFDRKAKDILIYEVEVTNALNTFKLEAYGYFWFLLDCMSETDWMPRLFVVDRYGTHRELSMEKLYYRVLAPHCPDEQEAIVLIGDLVIA